MSLWRPKARSARELWQFTRKSLRLLLFSQRTNLSPRACLSPSLYSPFKSPFQAAFSAYRSNSVLSPSLHACISSTPDEVLHLWVSELVRTEVQSEVQGQGVRAWVSSWWRRPIPLPDLLLVPAEVHTQDWVTVRVQVTKVGIGVVQSSQRSGDVMEGIVLEMQAIQVELRAGPTVGSLGIQRISVQTWRKGGKTETWDCLTAPDSAVPQVYVEFSEESVTTRVELASPVLTYSTDLQKQLLSLRSSLDFSAEESAVAWKAARNFNSLGKAAYSRLMKDTKQQFSLKVTSGTGLLLLSRGKTLKLAVPLLTLDQFPQEMATFGLYLSEISLIYKENDSETPILPSLSAHLDFSPCSIAAAVDSPVEIAVSSELLQSLQALRQDFEPDFVSLHESEKRTIMRSAVLQDLIERANSRLFAVLSGAYVYFFAEPTDLVAFSYFYVRDCSVSREGNCDLRIVSQKDHCEMRFSSESRRDAWVKELEMLIEDVKRDVSVCPKWQIQTETVSIRVEIPLLSVEIDHFVGVVEGLKGQYPGIGKEPQSEITWQSLILRESGCLPMIEAKGTQQITKKGSSVTVCLDYMSIRAQQGSIERLSTLVSACKRDFSSPVQSLADSSAPQSFTMSLICPVCTLLLEAEAGLMQVSMRLCSVSGELQTTAGLRRGKVTAGSGEIWDETGYPRGKQAQERWKMLQIAGELVYTETEIERKCEISVKSAELAYVQQPFWRLIQTCACFITDSEAPLKPVELKMQISDLILQFPLRPQCNSPGKLRIASTSVTKTALSQQILLQGITSLASSSSIQLPSADITLNSEGITVTLGDFEGNIGPEEVKWVLKLLHLNLSYSDHWVPSPPQANDREINLQIRSISLRLQTVPVCTLRTGTVFLGYKQGLEQWEVAGKANALIIAPESAKAVLKAAYVEWYCKSGSICSTWLTLNSPETQLNSPALVALQRLCTDSVPIYTPQDQFTPYDYLRPGDEMATSPGSLVTITWDQALLYLSDDTGGVGVAGTFGVRVGKAAVQRDGQAAMEGSVEKTVEIEVKTLEIVSFEGNLGDISAFSKRSSVLETLKVKVVLPKKKVTVEFEGLKVALSVPEFLRFARIVASLRSSAQGEPDTPNSTFSLYCNIKNVSLLLLATAPHGSFPLFRLNLPQFQLSAVSPKSSSNLKISLLGYNRSQNHWEPVIEPVKVKAIYDQSTSPSRIYIEFTSAVELTCSEAVLTSVFSAWANRNIESKAERLEIRNLTSYLLCSTYGQEQFTIVPGEQMTHLVDFLAYFCWESPLQPLALTVIDEQETLIALPDVDLRKFGTKRVKFGQRNWGTLALEIDSKGRKVLTVWAKLVFFNHTLIDFTLKCDKSQIYPLEVGKSCGISSPPQQLVEFLPSNGESSPLESSLEALLQPPCCFLHAGSLYLRVSPETTAFGTALHIHAPFTYRNYLPVPLLLLLGKQTCKRLLLNKGETYQDCDFAQDWGSYKVEVAGFASQWLDLQDSIELKLHKNDEIVHINVHISYKTAFTVSFYCQTIIKNSSYLPLQFFYDQSASQPIPSQAIHSDIVFIGKKEEIWTRFLYYKAEKLDIRTVGVQFPLILGSEAALYDLKYSVKAYWPAQDEPICTKIVTIAPKLVLLNGLKVAITVKQADTEVETRVDSKERVAIYWANSDLQRVLRVKTAEKPWSEPFPLCNSVSWLYCGLFVRVSLVVEQTSSLYLLEEELESALQVQNCTATWGVQYHQREYEDTVKYVGPGQCQRFSWTFPAKSHSLLLYIYSESEKTEVTPQEVNLDRLQPPKEVVIFQPKAGFQLLFISVVRRGYTKTVVITDISPSEEAQIDSICSILQLSVPRISLSLVSSPSTSYELLYISLINLEYQYIHTQQRCQSSLTIWSIHADAQYEGKCQFPVALLWSEDWDEQGKSLPALKIAVVSLLEEWNRVLHYEEVSVDCGPMEVKLESPLIQQLFDLGNRLRSGLPGGKEGDFLLDVEETPWWLSCADTDSLLCIEKLSISRLSMQLSLLFVPDSTAPDTLSPYMKARGLPPLGVSKAPLDLSSMETKGLCGFWSRVVNLLASSYVDELKESLIRLLSHVEGAYASGLIWASQGQQAAIDHQWQRASQAPSNAVEGLSRGTQALLQGLGEGFTGLVDRPIAATKEAGIQGLAKGLVQGVAGLLTRPVAGVLDLIKHTATGVAAGSKSVHFDDIRTRPPRPISTSRGLIQPYDSELARELQDWVGCREGRFARFRYLAHWVGKKSVFLYEECLFVFDGSEICLQIEPRNAVFTTSSENCIVFYNDSQSIQVVITKSKVRNRLLRKLTKISSF